MQTDQNPLEQADTTPTNHPPKRLEYRTPILEHHGSLQTITGSGPIIVPIGPGSNGP